MSAHIASKRTRLQELFNIIVNRGVWCSQTPYLYLVYTEEKMEYEGDLIAVYNDQTLPLECDIISKFKNEATGKSYLVYTDNSRNEEGKKNMFVVSYRPEIPEEDLAFLIYFSILPFTCFYFFYSKFTSVKIWNF